MVKQELQIAGTSELKASLVKWIKTKKAKADDVLKFVKFGLISKAKEITLKGIALAVGMPVDTNGSSDRYTAEKIRAYMEKHKIAPFTPKIREVIFTTSGKYEKGPRGKFLALAHKTNSKQVISEALEEILNA